MFKPNQIVKTAYGEILEVLEQIGNTVYFYGLHNSPVHFSKVFSI